MERIIRALSVVHEPRSRNDDRREAQLFLEEIKENEELPFWGYQLAAPENYNDNFIVRHFGLLLLQHSITKRFDELNAERVLAVRRWVVELCGNILPQDPHYLKEKLAFLWALVAKRVWGSHLKDDAGDEAGWVSMDADLWALWLLLSQTRELLLVVVRTLFEDIFLLDDAVALKRGPVLNQLSVLIVHLADVLLGMYEPEPRVSVCKHVQQGWFSVWSGFLVETLMGGDLAQIKAFVPKILATFKTCLHWVQPHTLRSENTLATLVNLLELPDVLLKTLAVDCLHILFTRSYASKDDFDFFIGSMYSAEGIKKLHLFYHSLSVDPDDIDEQTYALLKKTVEMVVLLSEYLNTLLPAKNRVDWLHADVGSYLQLVLETTNHPSLIISGLLLQMWVTTLRYDELSQKKEVSAILMDLLETAANRVLNYALFDDSHVERKFLDQDFDQAADLLPFLANYRKFNEDIVRIAVCQKPDEALQWLEARLEAFFSLPLGRRCISEPGLDEKSDAHNWGVAQFNIIENAVRGMLRWRIWFQGDDFEERNARLNSLVEDLGERLLAMHLAPYTLIRKQVQTMVQFAPLLKDVLPLMFKVLERILQTATFEYPENALDEEKEQIRDLRTLCGTELNRLAYIMPELLMKIFNELESVVAGILASNKVSQHENIAFKLFLLVIASRLLVSNKEDLFAKIVDPELLGWLSPETEKGLSDLHWFMERLGIVEIALYFQRRNITEHTNLLEATMDDEGRELKNKLKDHWLLIFPIRATRIFIQYSIEKLPHDLPEYLGLLRLWRPRVVPIIPHVLQLLAQIQAYHNPANWRELPASVQSFLHYSTMERFWQQGVLIQSKETFIEESVKAALTLRDFADSVGHLVRYTREYAFLTIGSLSQLEDTFYEIPGIAGQMWTALAGDTVGVTLHSWKHMINLCLRAVVKNCPVKYVDVFMAELLPKALTDLDALLSDRWAKVYMTGLQLQGNEDDATLSEEMMEEHMLRQLTATVVRFLMDIVPQVNAKAISDTQFACKRLVSENKDVMAAFLQICLHLIALKDTKCLFNTILVVRSVLQSVVLKDDAVDRYLCDEFLKSLVSVLLDDYFVETHSEAATAATVLYCLLRLKNDYPARVLMDVVPNISAVHVSNFENLLVSLKSLRHQRAALLELVAILKNVQDVELKHRQKDLEAVLMKKKKASDLMNDPLLENGALSNLFGEE